tara:strand:- start:11841 stop:12875 length:1035 start_codon:yes stop_codon:yes gene_type:complete
MALLQAEGWDLFPTNGATLASFTGSGWNSGGTNELIISTSQQRNGSACVGLTSSNAFGFGANLNLESASGTIAFGFAHKMISHQSSSTSRRPAGLGVLATTGESIILSYDKDVDKFTLWIDGVLIFTTTAFYTLGIYYFLELTYNGGTGAYEMFVDGASVTSGTGSLTGVSFDRIGIYSGQGPGNSSSGQVFFDDIYVSDGTRYGDIVVEYTFPDTDTVNADWTPASGVDGFAMVDNAPPNPVQYIETSTINDISDFDVANPSATVFQVFGVMVTSVALRTGASVEEFNTRLISGASVGAGATNVAPQTTAAYRRDIFDTDPDTGIAWTPAGVNGLQVGVEKTT